VTSSDSTTPLEQPGHSGQPRLTRPLYGHLVAATMVTCLVVVIALAVRSMAPWAAVVLLVSALTLAAHAAHVRRSGEYHHARRPPRRSSVVDETTAGHGRSDRRRRH